MMYLHGLVVCSLLLLGAAHLTIHISDSQNHIQEQTNTFTTARELSSDARGAFFPRGFMTRLFSRPRPQAGALPAAYGQEAQRAPHDRPLSRRDGLPFAWRRLLGFSGHRPESQRTIRAPLRMSGPYPALSLRFPDIPWGPSGVSLLFVVDTAANVNTIKAKLATDLSLAKVSDEGGIGAGGMVAGGATYMLGTAQLSDLPQSERFDFISNLTATALPVASPSGAGKLGIGFLLSFAGGVEFNWGLPAADDRDRAAAALVSVGEAGPRPSLTFFEDMRGTDGLTRDLTEVPSRQLEGGLICVTMLVNNVEIPSLLDTGSPISVLNAAAAKAAGIRMPLPEDTEMNLFAKAKTVIETDAAISLGEVAKIGGVDDPVILRKIPTEARIALGKAQGFGRPYVGEFSGLAALGGLGEDAGPAAVLGTDILRQRTRLVLQNGKVFV